jgi:hypothetical protein
MELKAISLVELALHSSLVAAKEKDKKGIGAKS